MAENQRESKERMTTPSLLDPFRRVLKTPEYCTDQLFPVINEEGELVGILAMREEDDWHGPLITEKTSDPSDALARHIKLAHIEIFEAHRSQGNARTILDVVCHCADENEITLQLVADAQSKSVDQARLEKFYESLGFVKERNVMRRDPKKH